MIRNKSELESDEVINTLISETIKGLPIGKDHEESLKEGLRLAIKSYMEMLEYLPKKNIAELFHQIIDLTIESSKKRDEKNFKEVSCKRKCSSCCSIAVSLSTEESLLLLDVSKKKNIPIDTTRLEKQAKESAESWHKLGREDMKCIFLKDDECSVYENRPSSCRTHFVMGSKMICDTYEHDSLVKYWKPLRIRILELAVILCGEGDLMPKKLLEIIKGEK